MMSVLPLTKIGLILNRPHYVEEAKRQFLLHAKYLADPTVRLTSLPLWSSTNGKRTPRPVSGSMAGRLTGGTTSRAHDGRVATAG